VDLGPLVVVDAEPAKLIQPGKRPLDDAVPPLEFRLARYLDAERDSVSRVGRRLKRILALTWSPTAINVDCVWRVADRAHAVPDVRQNAIED
jgi:hypothetical protein